MLLVGILSLVQICYLPGALVRRWLGLAPLDPVERLVYAFGLSLICNAVLVGLLTVSGHYSPIVLWAIVAAELGTLAILNARSIKRGRLTWIIRELASYRPAESFTGVLGFLLAGATVLIVLRVCYLNLGTVFSENDDVANWDRWAMEWARGILPTRAGLYPQLLPANWSMSYVLLGRLDIKMFAKATTSLFSLCTVLPFFSLYARRRDAGYLFGAAAVGALLLHYLGVPFLMLGYADVPVAFMGFLCFYVLYRKGLDLTAEDLSLSIVFGCGTVLTKQGGVFALIAALIYGAWRARRKPGILRFWVASKAGVAALASLSAVIAWYGFKAIQIHRGEDYSNLALLTQGLHHGRSYPARLLAAGKLVWNAREEAGPPVAVLFGALLAGSLWLRETRRMTLLLIAPFLLAWGFWFSYELRNGSLAIPAIGLVSGLVAMRVVERLSRPLDAVRWGENSAGSWCAAIGVFCISVWLLAGPSVARSAGGWLRRFANNGWVGDAEFLYGTALLVLSFGCVAVFSSTITDGTVVFRWPVLLTSGVLVAGVLASRRYDAEAIASQQLALQRRIGTPAVNERLYLAVKERNIRRPIMTDYWFVQALPGLEALFQPLPCGAPCPYDDLISAVKLHKPGYVLLYDNDLDAAGHARLENSKELETVFVESRMRFLEVK